MQIYSKVIWVYSYSKYFQHYKSDWKPNSVSKCLRWEWPISFSSRKTPRYCTDFSSWSWWLLNSAVKSLLNYLVFSFLSKDAYIRNNWLVIQSNPIVNFRLCTTNHSLQWSWIGMWKKQEGIVCVTLLRFG